MPKLINLAFILLMASICFADSRPADTAGHISATLVSADARSLTALIVSAPTSRPSPQTFALDPQTSIVRNDVDFGGIKTVPASIAELKWGARIVLTLKDQKLVEVRLLAPPPIAGRVVATDSRTFTVHPPRGADQKLRLDPQHTKVTQTRVQFGPMRTVTANEIKTGQSVSVLAKDGFAYIVRIEPSAPIIGRIKQISEKAVAIQPTTRPGQAAAGAKSFPLDRAKTELYHEYFGQPLEPAKWEQFADGMAAAVTIENGTAAVITLIHPAIYGTILKFGGDWIEVKPSAPPDAPIHRFTIDSRTEILLGQPIGAATQPSGKTTRFWRYVAGARLSDLKARQLVSVTAKDDLVLSMRVTPIPPPIASAR